MAAYREGLDREDDPARLATMAEEMPELPSFDAWADLGTLDITLPADEAEAVAEADARRASRPSSPRPIAETRGRDGSMPRPVAERIGRGRAAGRGLVRPGRARPTEPEADRGRGRLAPTAWGDVPRAAARGCGRRRDATTDEAGDDVPRWAAGETPEGFPTGEGEEAGDPVDRGAIMAALEAAAEAVVAAEAAADSAGPAEAAADVAETAAELLVGRQADELDSTPRPRPPWPRASTRAATRPSRSAERLANLMPGHGEGEAGDEPRTTQVVVSGLVSVASIASFKRHLGRLPGVQAVAVASGPEGEFVFNVTHRADLSFRDVIPTMPGFAARVTGTGDGDAAGRGARSRGGGIASMAIPVPPRRRDPAAGLGGRPGRPRAARGRVRPDLRPARPRARRDLLATRKDIVIAVIDAQADDLDGERRLGRAPRARPDHPRAARGRRELARLARRVQAPGHADDEYVIRPYSAESIRWRVEAMCIRSAAVDDGSGPILQGEIDQADWGRRGKTVIVFNPKGGVGKTMIATNLAAALVAKGQRVLLLDADTVTGHVPTSLGMDGVPTVVDAWRDEIDGGPVLTFDEMASVHTSGLQILPLTSSPMATELLEPQRVAGAIAVARRNVDYVDRRRPPVVQPAQPGDVRPGGPDPRPGHARPARDPGARQAARRRRGPRHASIASRWS